jgi:hypothetical protein
MSDVALNFLGTTPSQSVRSTLPRQSDRQCSILTRFGFAGKRRASFERFGLSSSMLKIFVITGNVNVFQGLLRWVVLAQRAYPVLDMFTPNMTVRSVYD